MATPRTVGTRNLLVVDWDYFFNQPADGGDPSTDPAGLYDWSHNESPWMVEDIWYHRGAAFIARDLPLPRCDGYRGFWDRFDIVPGTALMYADSNVYAGLIHPSYDENGNAESWDSVWLFDAHHDCGYRGTLDQWRKKGTYSAEDWMLTHAELGSALHVRYPQWKVRGLQSEPKPWVPVDRDFDDDAPVPVTFSAVYLCRSGAWVPSWCDDQFAELLDSYPFPTINVDDTYHHMRRPFDHARAEREAAIIQDVRRRMAAALGAVEPD